VGPYQRYVALPEVSDEGTASNMEGNCEYIEYVVTDSRQGVVLHLLRFNVAANHKKNLHCHENCLMFLPRF